MTDNEIIKALEFCRVADLSDCEQCPYFNGFSNCLDYLMPDVLSLINRQKAEIERLKDKVNLILKYDKRRDINLQARLIDEATKKCADRLKQQIKEMVGDDNVND